MAVRAIRLLLNVNGNDTFFGFPMSFSQFYCIIEFELITLARRFTKIIIKDKFRKA